MEKSIGMRLPWSAFARRNQSSGLEKTSEKCIYVPQNIRINGVNNDRMSASLLVPEQHQALVKVRGEQSYRVELKLPEYNENTGKNYFLREIKEATPENLLNKLCFATNNTEKDFKEALKGSDFKGVANLSNYVIFFSELEGSLWYCFWKAPEGQPFCQPHTSSNGFLNYYEIAKLDKSKSEQPTL
jgi:hypothetical protein